MPNTTNPTSGPYGATAIMPVRFGQLTFALAGTLITPDLFADGLPGVRLYSRQLAGPAVVSVQLQFANGSDGGGNIQWLPLIPPFAIAVAVPSVVPVTLGSRRYRVAYTSTGATTVEFRLVGTLT